MAAATYKKLTLSDGSVLFVASTDLVGAIPTGMVQAFAAATAPTGWVLCDGTSYLRTTYQALFDVIGTTWGSVDGTHFTVPDLRGRAPIGAGTGSGLSARALAATGGEENHVLNILELALHTHGSAAHSHGIVTYAGNGSAVSAIRGVDPALGGGTSTIGSTASTTPGLSGSTGGDVGHNTMQPFAVVTYIIKV